MPATWFVELQPPSPDPHSSWALRDHLPGRPAFERGYRMAVAMKGGVSLAIWIGGAVAELDLVRRIRVRLVDGSAVGFVLLDLRDQEQNEAGARAAVERGCTTWERASCYAG